ncbi:MAG TPA: 1-acyl-sn-glycerol-3-phosphate acyltransferase [SAR86 cluster bacterium]|nr:1-acyl-sn-glycerol-3-phosphate acyltransferase [SAR86 cluster bacterium]|tara:strand:- start:25135 stop:26271 length:1137 start_codon:yes stop_codon:yes gene_type:complete
MNFKDISPYSDQEVNAQIKNLINNQLFFKQLAKFLFPASSKLLPGLIEIFIKGKFKSSFQSASTIKEFQSSLAPYVKRMIDKTTDGFTFSGEENLSSKASVYIGNHRDIALDAAFLNFLLYEQKKETVRVAIGDNLLDGGFAETLMRLNKSFVVHRDIQGIKETLKKLTKLSKYIDQSLFKDNESIWIAQKEGRANDGNDFSDVAVLKMLYLYKRKDLSFSEWVKKINIIPISISYEYDPLDVTKARGWNHQEEMTLEEINESVLHEIALGLFRDKGRVHLHVCDPIDYDGDDIEELSCLIEQEILLHYKVWPTSHIAAKALSNSDTFFNYFDEEQIKANQESNFLNRFNDLDINIQRECLKTYARPLLNKKKARGEL